mgnify:CR=1 FL=1
MLSLAALLVLGSLISWVPVAALAAILIVIGARMIDRHSFDLLKQHSTILDFVVIAAVIVSWLTAFNVINQYNQFVRTILRILIGLTEPVFRPIRKVIPAIAGLDLSPIVVFVIMAIVLVIRPAGLFGKEM